MIKDILKWGLVVVMLAATYCLAMIGSGVWHR